MNNNSITEDMKNQKACEIFRNCTLELEEKKNVNCALVQNSNFDRSSFSEDFKMIDPNSYSYSGQNKFTDNSTSANLYMNINGSTSNDYTNSYQNRVS